MIERAGGQRGVSKLTPSPLGRVCVCELTLHLLCARLAACGTLQAAAAATIFTFITEIVKLLNKQKDIISINSLNKGCFFY